MLDDAFAVLKDFGTSTEAPVVLRKLILRHFLGMLLDTVPDVPAVLVSQQVDPQSGTISSLIHSPAPPTGTSPHSSSGRDNYIHRKMSATNNIASNAMEAVANAGASVNANSNAAIGTGTGAYSRLQTPVYTAPTFAPQARPKTSSDLDQRKGVIN
jgi:hypothetical protein